MMRHDGDKAMFSTAGNDAIDGRADAIFVFIRGFVIIAAEEADVIFVFI